MSTYIVYDIQPIFDFTCNFHSKALLGILKIISTILMEGRLVQLFKCLFEIYSVFSNLDNNRLGCQQSNISYYVKIIYIHFLNNFARNQLKMTQVSSGKEI